MRPRVRHLGLALALVLAGCTALFGGQPAPTPTMRSNSLYAAQATAAPAAPAAPDIRTAAQRVSPAVVQITNQQEVTTGQFRQPIPETAGIGSGVIYDPSGLILTNNHVIQGASAIVVALPDGRTFQGRLLGADPQTDLAVVKVDASGLPVAALGDSNSLAVGDWVVAIGNALALSGGPTVTAGIVSALNRAVQSPPPESTTATPGPGGGQAAGPYLFDLIQTDAPINPGNSGGPLTDLQGNVVGINTLIAVSTPSGTPVEGIGFATSINVAKNIADQLVATGHAVHAYLGIEYVPLNPALAARLGAPSQRGAYITGVDAASPAARAGLQQGDVILAINGQQIQNESDLARIINQFRPGDTITLTVQRDGQRLSLQATLAQQPGT